MGYYHQNERDEAVSIGCLVLTVLFLFSVVLLLYAIA